MDGRRSTTWRQRRLFTTRRQFYRLVYIQSLPLLSPNPPTDPYPAPPTPDKKKEENNPSTVKNEWVPLHPSRGKQKKNEGKRKKGKKTYGLYTGSLRPLVQVSQRSAVTSTMGIPMRSSGGQGRRFTQSLITLALHPFALQPAKAWLAAGKMVSCDGITRRRRRR